MRVFLLKDSNATLEHALKFAFFRGHICNTAEDVKPNGIGQMRRCD